MLFGGTPTEFIAIMMKCALADLGGHARHTPPLWDPILSFLHTFSSKSAHVRGPRPPPPPPPMGNPGSAHWCVS